MKQWLSVWCGVVLFLGVGSMTRAEELKTGATKFLSYEGSQKWPTGKVVEANEGYAVPIYEGLPAKKFTVLGRIVDQREGVDLIGKEMSGFFGGSKQRLKHCANQAKLQGGEAVIITDHAEVLKAFHLSRRDASEESPLTKNRKTVVLVVTF